MFSLMPSTPRGLKHTLGDATPVGQFLTVDARASLKVFDSSFRAGLAHKLTSVHCDYGSYEISPLTNTQSIPTTGYASTECIEPFLGKTLGAVCPEPWKIDSISGSLPFSDPKLTVSPTIDNLFVLRSFSSVGPQIGISPLTNIQSIPTTGYASTECIEPFLGKILPAVYDRAWGVWTGLPLRRHEADVHTSSGYCRGLSRESIALLRRKRERDQPKASSTTPTGSLTTSDSKAQPLLKCNLGGSTSGVLNLVHTAIKCLKC